MRLLSQPRRHSRVAWWLPIGPSQLTSHGANANVELTVAFSETDSEMDGFAQSSVLK
jgi:hypothetical protein